MTNRVKSLHQQRVEEFMRLAGQDVPEQVRMMSAKTRVLRARLIFEEVMETINRGLGVSMYLSRREYAEELAMEDVEFTPDGDPDLIELADGCADIKVTTTGTLSAAGITDMLLQQEVDLNNLKKFGPGGYRHPETNKWIKPPDFMPPDIKKVLIHQGCTPYQFGAKK